MQNPWCSIPFFFKCVLAWKQAICCGSRTWLCADVADADGGALQNGHHGGKSGPCHIAYKIFGFLFLKPVPSPD